MRNTIPAYRKKDHLGPRRPRRCPCAWRRTPRRSRCSSQPRPGGRACDHPDPASHRCGGAERRPGWCSAWREANRSSARKRESERPTPLRRRSAQTDDTRRHLASNGVPWPGFQFTEHASIRIPAPSPQPASQQDASGRLRQGIGQPLTHKGQNHCQGAVRGFCANLAAEPVASPQDTGKASPVSLEHDLLRSAE